MTENFTKFEARVRALTSSMTPAELRIATLLIDDPAGVSQMSINELAAVAGTSESTIVRAARALGFKGYQHLRLALAAIGAVNEPEVRPTLTGDIGRDDSLDVAIKKLAAAEEDALRVTAEQLDVAELRSVVTAMASARRIDIFGVGVSGLVAMDLAQKLMRVGRMCFASTETHQALTCASLLGPSDVALAISHSGEIVDVLEPLRMAKQLGATTVALTSHRRSPLARLAQHALISAGREEPLRPGAMASRTSQLLVADAIFVGVAQTSYDASLNALRQTTDAVDSRRQRDRSRRG